MAIIRRALSAPARTILRNAGEEESVIVGRLLEGGITGGKEFSWGYDAARGRYVDMVCPFHLFVPSIGFFE